jgi:hypothetical protein
MPEVTIKHLYYTALDGQTYNQGETVDLEKEDVERGTELGAFEGTEAESDPVAAAFPNSPGDPGGTAYSSEGPDAEDEQIHEGDQAPSEESQPTVSAELSDEEIDSLKGQELDDALEDAGIPAANRSAAEKRQVLKDAR